MQLSATSAPALTIWFLAAGAISVLAVLALASPDLYDAVVRGGEPMEPVSRHRLDFLRLVLAPLAVAALAFCLYHRSTTDWRPLQMLVFSVPLAAILTVVLYKVEFGVEDARFKMFVREDGPVEYATAIVFLIGSLVAASASMLARDIQTRVFLGLFALAMLLVALSEVSFGQRLIGLDTPEILMQVNRQKEISVHNIFGIEFVVYDVMPQVIFAYALFGRWFAGYLQRSPLGPYLSRDLLAVAPMPWYSVSYFLPMVIFSVKQLTVEDAFFKDQEPSELFLAIGFLLVALRALVVLRRPADLHEPLARRTQSDANRRKA